MLFWQAETFTCCRICPMLSNDIAALRVGNSQWLVGMPGVTTSGGQLNITYSFDATTPNNANYATAIAAQGRTVMTVQQEAAARAILVELESIINVHFVETGTNSAAIKFWTGDLPTYGSQWGTIGIAYFPSNSGSDVTLDNVAERATAYAAGSFNYAALIHEMGHAMGLSHPGGYGPNAAYNSDGTVMSYNDGHYSTDGYVSGSYINSAPQGYQIFDIAALQSVYGANRAYNATDTTYEFDGSMYKKTVWDGGGIDTYSVAPAFAGAVTIDLRAGLENRTHLGQTDVWTAFNANIENAITRGGADSVFGNDLHNTINTNAGNDTVYAYNGNDSIYAGLGDDWVDGGNNNDFIFGDDNSGLNGDDRLIGNAGNDTIYAYGGNDTVSGNNDNDRLYGMNGNDTLSGDDGNDWLEGNADNDSISGGSGADSLVGGTGDDTIKGDDGNDFLYGEAATDLTGGNDIMVGGTGNDRMWGYAGNDSLNGALGSDVLYGGADNDMFVYNSKAFSNPVNGIDWLMDFNPADDRINTVGLGYTGIGTAAAFGTMLNYTYLAASGVTQVSDYGRHFVLYLAGHLTLDNTDFIFS
ncbi:hypothetical protein GC177_04230 [bacterium]|nr:hypothetical protein [bacterium]